MASALLLSAGSDYNGVSSLFELQEGPINEYTTNTVQVPFQASNLAFGDLAYSTLPKRDDVIKSITLKSTLGSLYPVVAQGYVYPQYSSNIDSSFYSSNGVLQLSAIGVYGYYNTQLLANWAQPFVANVSVSVINNTFSFQNINGAMFTSEQAASFWGFDIRYAYTSNPWKFSTSIPQFNLVQSGWIPGFLPPPQNFTYYDSVGYLLPKISRLLIGGQTIQTINSQTLYTETDLETPFENQAGLTILVGKNDPTSQMNPRNYWTKLTFEEIPISQLENQDVQVAIQFETLNNLTSRSLVGGLLNSSAYTPYSSALPLQNVIKVFTYNGYIIVFSRYNSSRYITLINELTGSVIQVLEISTGSAPCIAFGKLYFITDFKYLTSYDISSTGFINPITSSTNIQYSPTDGVDGMLAIGKYLFILYDTVPVVYDITTGIYTHLSISLQTYFTSKSLGTIYSIHTPAALSTGTNIYYPITSSTGIYIFYINILKFIAGDVTAYGIITLLNNSFYEFRKDRSVSDGRYIYYPFEFIPVGGYVEMYRLDTFTNTVQYSPAFESVSDTLATPQIFDGIYIYYFDDESTYDTYRYYDTRKNFSDPTAWTSIRMYHDLLGVSDGVICLGTLYNYNIMTTYTSTYIIKMDPYVIVPSLTASLIVEYSKLIHPVPSSNTIVKQTQMNTFTMRAGVSTATYTFTFTGPIREFWIKSNASIARLIIELNGFILADEDYNSINILRPFENHSITPYQTTATYTIALDPNKLEPTGTMNISRIRLATMTVYFKNSYSTDQTIYVFARSMNVLQCNRGIGGLLFN
jgi:hypothetical protein